MTENRNDYPDNNALHQFCKNYDYEAKILTDWQKALADIHGKNSLTIPGVFVDSHVDWENTNEKQKFMKQAQTLLKEIRSRQEITCDTDCIQRMEISVAAIKKAPKILGPDDTITVEEGTKKMKLVCEMFFGFEKSFDNNTQLNWIRNHRKIQDDPGSNIEITRSERHGISKRTTLIIHSMLTRI
jgi:hypothetical protein